ncbi:hypothetical protein [Hymenobacter lucidus]|uniref:Lipoprotein n=1 Tax=Hymenobacter lucidus TaxID=2880930 RepID=A0ABS8ASP9_9BACT|nr:hypothetical protein [Hymenobacter lucidus]MCB2408633.1 hypothetical protein [Hymenobacter lucidus]
MKKGPLLAAVGALLVALACQRQGQVQMSPPANATSLLEPDEVPDPDADSLLPVEAAPSRRRNYYLGMRRVVPVAPQVAVGLDTLLQRYDLTGVIRTGNMDGFGDARHYRYEVAFTNISPDPQQPAVWRVSGKTRYKHVIRSFSGTISWQQLYRLAETVDKSAGSAWGIWNSEDETEVPRPLYSITGRFQLQESNGGQLRGQVNADFALGPDKKASANNRNILEGSPACGAGVLFEGERLNAAGQVSRSVVWGSNFIRYAYKVTSQMTMGLRGPEISPAYVARGWNEYYQHDEWWADTPAPDSQTQLWPSAAPTE